MRIALISDIHGNRIALEAVLADCAASGVDHWTRGFVTATGWFDWLAALPFDHRYTAPNGARVLAVHAAPGTDDGEGIHAGRSNAELDGLIDGSDADLIVVGHTHEPMVRRVGAAVVVNLGSVGNPRSNDLRASYGVLDVTATDVSFVHRGVAYDYAAFAESVRLSRHPAASFIMSHQRGEQCAHSPHSDHVPTELGRVVDVTPAGRVAAS